MAAFIGKPMHPLDHAIAALQSGRPAEAEAICRRELAADPRDFDAWRVLAFALDALGRAEEALQASASALSIQPRHAETLFNRANSLHRLRRFAEAVAAYDLAAEADPAFAAVWFNRGNALQALGRRSDAVESYERAIALKPDFADAQFNRAVALTGLKHPDQALAALDGVLVANPSHAEAWRRRGSMLVSLRRPAEALASVDRALALKPDDAEAWTTRGMALRALKRPDEALAAYDRTLALKPGHPHAPANRGNILHDQKRYEEALIAYEAALAADPAQPRAFGGAADCAIKLCDWDRRARYAAELPGRIADPASIIGPLIVLGYTDDPALHLACARKFAGAEVPHLPEPLSAGRKPGKGKLRIAYLSADFREHPVARLMAPILEGHDRSRFEVIGLAFGSEDTSAMTARLTAACDAFHDIRKLDDAAAAKLLFEAGADIAIDLTGHTHNARAGIFARRPAPVQASYLGFPASLGAPWMDYIIADAVVAPVEDEANFDEAVVRLPGGYWPGDGSEAPPGETPSRAELGLPDQGFVFACFNTMWKISPPVFDVWMRLLAAVPGSVLWLHRDNATAEVNLRREAAARGVDPSRLVFKDRVPAARHMALHRLADLFLDTLPYNAHATASDALAAGLPVLTCKGGSFASRVGASLLNAAGLPELITGNLADYEAVALRLARDPAGLAALRARLSTEKLFNTPRFIAGLEAAYETMAERSRKGLAPESFSVTLGSS